MLTLGELKTSSVVDISTVGVSDKRFAQRANDACRRLTRRGDFVGALGIVTVCVNNGCVVWPRHVKEIRKINLCNHNIPHFTLWHDWMSLTSYGNFRGGGWLGWNNWNGGVVDRPDAPCFSDIWGTNRTVRMYHQASVDIGKTLQLFGTDFNGQPLMDKGPNGAYYSDGLTLTCKSPYAETTLNGNPYFIQNIARVLRQATQKPVSLFACQYAPNPTYQFGSVYNVDTGQNVTATLIGSAGAEFIQLDDSQSPVNSTMIGYLYNTDLASWQPVVAHGTPGSYYLEYGTSYATAPVTHGGALWNETHSTFQNLTLNGAIGAQYPYVNSPLAAPLETVAGQLEALAVYTPNETNPSYLKTSVRLGCNNGSSVHRVASVVKLRHIDAVADTDILVIDNLDAMKLAFQAIQLEEDSEKSAANEFWLAAVDECNRQTQEAFPNENMSVNNGSLSAAPRSGRQRVF